MARRVGAAASHTGFAGHQSWVDIVVTALAFGGGTKPLHDLIKNIEKAKEEREDRSAAAGSATE